MRRSPILLMSILVAVAAAFTLSSCGDERPKKKMVRATTEDVGVEKESANVAKTTTESAGTAGTSQPSGAEIGTPAPTVETPTPTTAPTSAPVSPQKTQAELIAEGEKYFKRKKCSTCHKTTGVLAMLGPNLCGVASRLSEAEMRKWIDNPGAIKPGTKMPPWDGTDQELDAVIAFLRSL